MRLLMAIFPSPVSFLLLTSVNLLTGIYCFGFSGDFNRCGFLAIDTVALYLLLLSELLIQDREGFVTY